MTLDEAIKHCEEKAKELSDKAYAEWGKSITEEEAYDCNECAREHEQLAEWLKELKAFREGLPAFNRRNGKIQTVLECIRPKGEWMYNDYGNGCGNWHCSVCDHMPYYATKYMRFLNFCPNCGADMRGGAE